jgi:toxin ParE1/3/4
MNQIVRRPAANRDLVETFRHYARIPGMRVADRFFAQAEATFTRLARMPGMGTPYQPEQPLHAELRYFPIWRFRDYIVFYQPLPDGIEVDRVPHGARDIDGILAEELGVEEDADDAESDEEGR